MPKTIDDLVNICEMDTLPCIPVIADYFGLQNCNENSIPIILGVYQKMLKPQPFGFGIDKNKIEKAFLENNLDELIHDTYQKNGKTGYYKLFCDGKMKIQNYDFKTTC